MTYSTIIQGRFCGLALMRIERDETAKAYFDEIIQILFGNTM